MTLNAGLDVDEFAPRISFFFNSHSDFFEEIAKYRHSGRRIWAHGMMRMLPRRRSPRSWQLRFHSQTAGVTLTAQQPYNNVVRTALQAMAAVLGGTQSLHTNSLDEALALPTAEAATLALRTQQIIAYETGVTDVVDPLGGSYFVEKLTRDLEEETLAYFDTIDRMGGMVEAIEKGYPQREIAESAYRFQQAVEQHDKVIVGVNDFVTGGTGRGEPIRVLHSHRRLGIRAPAGEAQAAATDSRSVPRRAGAGRPENRRQGRRQHDAAHHRGRASLCNRRRNVRRLARGVGGIRGNSNT